MIVFLCHENKSEIKTIHKNIFLVCRVFIFPTTYSIYGPQLFFL